MTELVLFITRSLVDKPEQVTVNETSSPGGVLLELRVAGDDMGKVIGKQGRIAKSIRAIVRAAAAKENVNVTLEIV